MVEHDPESVRPRLARASGVAPRKKPSLNTFLSMAPMLDRMYEVIGGAFAISSAEERHHRSPRFGEMFSEDPRSLRKIPLEFDECDAYLEIILSDDRKKTLDLAHSASVGEVSVGMAHDLNNVLTSLWGGVDILLESLQPITNPHVSKIMQEMRSVLETGMLITRRFGQVGSKKRVLNEENLRELVESALSLARPSFQCKKVSVENNVGPDVMVAIVSNDVQLTILNIVINAVEHGFQENGRIRIDAHAADENVFLRIENDGLPIPDEIRGSLFKEPLSSHCNLGYGLYISAMNIRSFGGDIDFVSDQEKTVFIVRLPAVPAGHAGG